MAKKRATLKEMKAPDEFQEAMGKVVEFFRLYGGWIGAAAGIVLVGILLGVFLSRHQEATAIKAGRAFDKAAAAVLTLEDPTAAPEAKDGVDAASAVKPIQSFIDDHKGSALASTAKLALGTALLKSGDYEGAMAAFKGFIEAYPTSNMALTAWEAYGEAADRAGNMDEAEAGFRQLTESTQPLFRINGYMHLGDLTNPAIQTTGGDAAKAREQYEKGLAEITGEDDLLPAAQLIARKVLHARLSNLP